MATLIRTVADDLVSDAAGVRLPVTSTSLGVVRKACAFAQIVINGRACRFVHDTPTNARFLRAMERSVGTVEVGKHSLVHRAS